jgi:SAM-dependent methyltransferase
VLGVDIATNLVEAGKQRARAAGVSNCSFQEGDASDLRGLEDRSFDFVVSFFGAMFAPRPFDVAKEMVRVTRPGGRIVMGNWIPNDPTLVAQILKLSSHTRPAAGGIRRSMTWGVETRRRAFQPRAWRERISLAQDTFTFRQPRPPSELVARFRQYYGPTMSAFEAAAKAGRDAELQRELEELFEAQNQSPSKDATHIPATFLRVSVSV